jgi:hypothetical protein
MTSCALPVRKPPAFTASSIRGSSPRRALRVPHDLDLLVSHRPHQACRRTSSCSQYLAARRMPSALLSAM